MKGKIKMSININLSSVLDMLKVYNITELDKSILPSNNTK